MISESSLHQELWDLGTLSTPSLPRNYCHEVQLDGIDYFALFEVYRQLLPSLFLFQGTMYGVRLQFETFDLLILMYHQRWVQVINIIIVYIDILLLKSSLMWVAFTFKSLKR